VDGADLCLGIADNGHGFSHEESDARAQYSGNGLTNMRQRVESLGGRWDLESGNEGTRISIRIPTRLFRMTPT
jgi:two-component system NarL family sensor kinase